MLKKAYIFLPGWEKLIQHLNLSSNQVIKTEFSIFANGEKKVRLQPEDWQQADEVVIVGSLRDFTTKDQNIFYLLLLSDALKRAGIKNITLFAPFLPYSRQDRIINPVEPISASLLFELLKFAKINKLITFNLHNSAQEGLFDGQIIHINLLPQLVESVIDQGDVIVAPDIGRTKDVNKLSTQFDKQQAILLKQRDLQGKVSINTLIWDVKNKNVIIVDDMIDTWWTMIKALETLKSYGAQKITIVAVHGLFSPPAQQRFQKARESKLYDQILVADTIIDIPQIPELETKNIVLKYF